jgi:hypothetical protein
VLQDIDSDYLGDFEIEDGRFDLVTKLELVVSALSALEEYWEGKDAATLIWSVFYDTLLPPPTPTAPISIPGCWASKGEYPKAS